MATFERDFIAGSANTISRAVLWLKSRALPSPIVVFAIDNLVAIANAYDKEIICTLPGHTARINTLAQVENSPDSYVEIVSGGEDGSVIVWRCSESDTNLWTKSAILRDIESSVTTASATHTPLGTIISASNTQGDIIIWGRASTDSNFIIVEKILMSVARIVQDIHFVTIQDSPLSLLVILGCVDSKIYLRLLSMAAMQKTESYLVGSLFGHEDWVTSIDSIRLPQHTIFASGSQDSKIRLWTIQTSSGGDINVPQAQDAASESDSEAEEEEGAAIVVEEEQLGEARCAFSTDRGMHSIHFDALLIGHEDWVTSVRWFAPDNVEADITRLFSTSMDRNMIIWQSDTTSGIWLPSIRIGDIGGCLGGSVGANLLGFVSGCVWESGVLGVGFGGAFHMWRRTSTADNEDWHPEPFLTGHFSGVHDVTWDVSGDFLLTVSADQTCRMWNEPVRLGRWVEISRPQIHGYDLNCIAIDDHYRLFTGGDEKVIRVFDCPQNVVDGVSKFCGSERAAKVLMEDAHRCDRFFDMINIFHSVRRAYIPELGLSTKAATLMTAEEATEESGRGVEVLEWTRAPLEGQLSDHTIWLEKKKLLGHKNDVICLVLSPDGRYIASACKGRDITTSAILIWDTISRLALHESTVVSLKFSPQGRYLISGGKDRVLGVHQRQESETEPFALVAYKKNAHKRIIWDMSSLITASRDGTCKIWRVDVAASETLTLISTFTPCQGASVTALDILSVHDAFLCVIGSEHGEVVLWQVGLDLSQAVSLSELYETYRHGSAVKRLSWNKSKENGLQFASAGDDHTVRIFRVVLS